jgi:phosphoribosyl-ATP pyrophosphohydrolase
MGFGGQQLGRYNETMSNSNSNNLDSILAHLADVVDNRRADLAAGKVDASSSYIAQLFTKGDDAILKKIGEEATETVMAAKDSRQHQLDPKYQQLLVGEMADLWFHCLVALSRFNLRPEDVLAELKRREGTSGIAEKASRKT